VEICCVGPQAEQLHDSVDDIVEAQGALDVITTAHVDYTDACEYVRLTAGEKSAAPRALVSSHPELAALLEAMGSGE
jgi:hypothetical protein